MSPEFFGSAAAILTTASFAPQAIKVIRSNDTEALSLVMYAMFTIGVFLWLVYGAMIGSWPMIVGNIITLGLAMVILIQKIRHTAAKSK